MVSLPVSERDVVHVVVRKENRRKVETKDQPFLKSTAKWESSVI